MATDIARVVHRQAIAGGDPPEGQRAKRVEDAEQSAAPTPGAAAQPQPSQPTPTLAIAFDRLARTIRRTIALARKLSEPDRAPPSPKPHPADRCDECCPNARQRRTDLAETDALHAEPCERSEAADFDADEDLDDDLDDLIATLRHDNGLATLTDARLRQHRTAQSAQAGTPAKNCAPCARGARPTATPTQHRGPAPPDAATPRRHRPAPTLTRPPATTPDGSALGTTDLRYESPARTPRERSRASSRSPSGAGTRCASAPSPSSPRCARWRSPGSSP